MDSVVRILRRVAKIISRVSKAGLIHGHMHGGNILYDKDTDLLSIIDLDRIQSMKSPPAKWSGYEFRYFFHAFGSFGVPPTPEFARFIRFVFNFDASTRIPTWLQLGQLLRREWDTIVSRGFRIHEPNLTAFTLQNGYPNILQILQHDFLRVT